MPTPQKAADPDDDGYLMPPTYGQTMEDLQQLAAYVAQWVHTPEMEWMAAIVLQRDISLIDAPPALIYQGRDCPMPDTPYGPILDYAKRLEAHRLISLRYHPHPRTPLTHERQKRFQDLQREAMRRGIPLENHLSLDSTGEVISWKHWGQSGVSGVLSIQALLANSIPSIILVTSLITSG
jgi:hypothetical protein